MIRTLVLRILFLVLISLLVACRRNHDVESFYPSLVEAQKGGAVTRGWIPADILPASSHEIRLAGDLSPSKEWCAFEFAPADSQIFRKNLKSDLPEVVSRVPSPGVSWWPVELSGNLDVAQIHKDGFDLYTIERQGTAATKEDLLFAIDWSKARAFFYSSNR